MSFCRGSVRLRLARLRLRKADRLDSTGMRTLLLCSASTFAREEPPRNLDIISVRVAAILALAEVKDITVAPRPSNKEAYRKYLRVFTASHCREQCATAPLAHSRSVSTPHGEAMTPSMDPKSLRAFPGHSTPQVQRPGASHPVRAPLSPRLLAMSFPHCQR